jgi:zinc-finger of transposase IS204/IS1001/IS1096/IS1165
MDPREMALFSRVFHLPAGIAVTSVRPSASELVIAVACATASMPCPECHQSSARIHGHYQRTVADLPCAGRNVLLMLTVRKFVCSTPTCSHKIFTERLPGLVKSYGRMTPRLIALVQSLGLVAGRQMGTRQAERTGIATNPSTLLRHLMQIPTPVTRAVRVLGVDDFAWKKRFTYGTILVDLERRKIIDVRGFSRKRDRRSLVKRTPRSRHREQRSWQRVCQSREIGRTSSTAGGGSFPYRQKSVRGASRDPWALSCGNSPGRSACASVGKGSSRAHTSASNGSHMAAAHTYPGEESPSGTSSQS